MVRAVIIEDEPRNMRILTTLIAEFCPMVTIVGTADNARSGESAIRDFEPDLVFLDIEMPLGSGFEILNNLMPINFEVIFVTAFDKYMIQAFKYCVIDYLLKPVNIDELKYAVQNAVKRIEVNKANLQVANLLNNLRADNPGSKKIALPVRGGYDFVRISDIIRCEASGSYCTVYINGGVKMVAAKNLKEYESVLPSELFFRIHNAHLINLSFVRKYNQGRGGYVEMEDGSIIEVATRKKNEFLQRVGLKSQ
jgi:two-component system, LytTR family, response regulator